MNVSTGNRGRPVPAGGRNSNVVASTAGPAGAGQTIQQVMAILVEYIEEEERNRGEIARIERSHPAPFAEQAQEILDDIIFMLLGIPDRQRPHIRDRLIQML